MHKTDLAASQTMDDLRTATRFRQEPNTAFATIRHSVGGNLRVEVYDESLFGICLVMSGSCEMSVGDEIELIYTSTPLHGTVKHVTPYKDGSYLVGLATLPVSGEPAATAKWASR